MARYIPKNPLSKLKGVFIPPKQNTDLKLIMEALENQQKWIQNIGEVVQDIQEDQKLAIRNLTYENNQLTWENNLLKSQLASQEKVKMESEDDEALDDGLLRLKNNIQDVLKAMKDI